MAPIASEGITRKCKSAQRRLKAMTRSEAARAIDRLIVRAATGKKVKRSHSYWRTYREQRKAGMLPLEARKVAKEQVLKAKLDRTYRERNRLAGALIGIQ